MIALAGPAPDRLKMLALQHLAAGDREVAQAYARRLMRSYPDRKPSPPTQQLLQSN